MTSPFIPESANQNKLCMKILNGAAEFSVNHAKRQYEVFQKSTFK